MAIVEKYESRVTRESSLGTNMTRVFHMTHFEFNNRFDMFVGYELGESNLDGDFTSNARGLRVTDKHQVAIDNENTSCTVFYSSSNSPGIAVIPNSANSWVETFDISPVDESVTTYQDQGNGNILDWAKDWAARKPDGASSEEPELILRKSHVVFNVTAYSSALWLNRIMLSVNRINGINFMNNYFAFGPQRDIDSQVNIDDWDQWLFAACPITRIGRDLWRYDFAFEYSGFNDWGWNEVDGIEVVRYNNKNPFTNKFFNFMDLFIGMDIETGTDVSIHTGRG